MAEPRSPWARSSNSAMDPDSAMLSTSSSVVPLLPLLPLLLLPPECCSSSIVLLPEHVII
jgi:hypothetical protein